MPTFAAIARNGPGRLPTTPTIRWPRRTPVIDTMSGSCGRACRNSAIVNDIVLIRDETPSNCTSAGQTRHPARRPRRGQHDLHRRRARHPEGVVQAHRIAHPDGHDSAWEADGWAVTQDR